MDDWTNLPFPGITFNSANLCGIIAIREGQDTIFHKKVKETLRVWYNEAKNIGWLNNDLRIT